MDIYTQTTILLIANVRKVYEKATDKGEKKKKTSAEASTETIITDCNNGQKSDRIGWFVAFSLIISYVLMFSAVVIFFEVNYC